MNRYLDRGIGWLSMFALALTIVSTVHAEPGDGITLGSATLTPRVELEFGADSNPRRLADVTRQETGESFASGIVDIHPAINLSYKRQQLRVLVAYEHGIRLYSSDSLSNYYDEFRLNASAELMAEGMFGLVLQNESVRRYRPSESAEEDLLNRRSYNDFQAMGRYSPGSALDLNLGVGWLLDVQEYAEFGGAGSAPTKNSVTVTGRGKWRFFPRTSVLMDMELGRNGWSNLPTGSDREKAAKSNEWHFLTGVGGQFTEVIQANLFLGYGGLYTVAASGSPESLLDDVRGAKGFLGQAQLIYQPNVTQSLSLGFARSYGDSAVIDYWISNVMYAGYSGLYFSRLSIQTRAALDLRALNPAVKDSANSLLYVTALYISTEYRITNWLSATGSVDALQLGDIYGKFVLLVGLRGIY